jgi:hypothetical protein
MAEQEKKPGGADSKKKKFYGGRFTKGATTGRSPYKGKVQGLESNTFYVGASSDPANLASR